MVFEKRQGFTGVLRALLWPTEGVVEVGVNQSIWAERTLKPPVEAFRFQISKTGYLKLRSYLRATIASEEPVGVVGNSRFVSPGRPIICSTIAITIRRRACVRQGCSYFDVASLDSRWFCPEASANNATPLEPHNLRLFPGC